MARHMSNSERIARLAAEVEAGDREKAQMKKAAPVKRAAKARAPKEPVRMKIVWRVGEPGSATSKTYPYASRAAADAEATRLGKNNMVTALKVPMDE